MSVYDYEYTSIENKTVSMSEYEGQVLLIVNTASKCGFTPQYKGMEELYKQYKDRGLTVIGFPCNQFMGQEPGAETEILEFCSARYGVTFPLSQKVDVREGNVVSRYEPTAEPKDIAGDIEKLL